MIFKKIRPIELNKN